MAHLTRRRLVRKLVDGRWTSRSDRVAVEEPLEIRIGGEAFAVTMRTPGDDIDLINGYCYAEGIIDSAAGIQTARYCDGAGPDGLNTYNVLDLTLRAGVPPPDPGLRRNVLTSSACGVCGSVSIDQLMDRVGNPLPPGPELPAELISQAPDRLRERQQTFGRTG